MSRHPEFRYDVAGYALGTLDPGDRSRFEEHLVACDACRDELAELEPIAALGATALPVPVPPPGLAARTLLAVEHAATSNGHVAAGSAREALRAVPAAAAVPRRRLRARPLAFAGAALAAAVIAALVVVGLGRTDDPGPLEAQATLRAPSGGAVASLDVFFTGIGRVVEFDTDDLPILPKGEYYELWFVGPGDRPGAPERISAGTFHPDEQGRSQVSFTAAVDPAKYPGIAVTAEPGDGDPSPSGPDVLRGSSEPR